MKFRQSLQIDPLIRLKHLLSAPFIYSMIFPLITLDMFLEIYHRISFPLYGMKPLKRSRYILIDRQKLQYLKPLEKVNCMYCGYANGLLNYASVIAAETEGYWCGIRHQSRSGFVEPSHHKHFLNYGDKSQFEAYVNPLKSPSCD